MATFTLTLVRHGETIENREKVIQGQLDTTLSEKGIEQAELLGRRLQYDLFTHTFCSDLKRARQTCEIILKNNKVCKCAIVEDQQLRERKYGIFEGEKRATFLDTIKKEKNSSPYTPPGGESQMQLRDRAVTFFNDLCCMLRSAITTRTQHRDSCCSNAALDETNDSNMADSSDTVTMTMGGSDDQLMFTMDGYNDRIFSTYSTDLCPNVSLVPTQRPLVNVSSVGSGGLNSGSPEEAFAERLDVPCLAVLVVTHGGLLREMLSHFIDTLTCVVPGGRGRATCITPNTGVCRFTVSLLGGTPHLTCLALHDCGHLMVASPPT